MKQRARQLGSIAINYDPPTEEQIAAAADWVIRFAEHWRSPKPLEI
ncbi:MAG: hypothetical protein JOZ21_00045 [Verrucomicrobia bacterium]|nr:hypothetical protein [Verrucomicrobiota bacterium]